MSANRALQLAVAATLMAGRPAASQSQPPSHHRVPQPPPPAG